MSPIKALREWWTGTYESAPIVLGQPYGPGTAATCQCGRVMSSDPADWVRVEATHTFETACPNCGPVQGGQW